MVNRHGLHIILLLLVSGFFLSRAYADEATADEVVKKEKVEWVALKNNLLYDAVATPNLQLEIRLAPHWSLELGAGFNPFPLDDTKFPKWRHVSAHIAPRYWFCNVFHRDFISINAAYVHYNVAGGTYPIGWLYKQVKDNRYQGDAVMAGISYGWHFAISPHFSVELEAGVDAGYSWYDQFECKHCGEKTASGGRWLVLPKAGINLVVPLGGDQQSLARRCDCEKLEESPEPVAEPEPVPAAPDTAVAAAPVEEEPVDEPMEPFIAAAPLAIPLPQQAAPVVAFVPPFVPKVDQMHRLRSSLLRDAEAYEPYDPSMALSADPRNVFIFFDVNVTKMDRSFIANDKLMDSIIVILGEAMADSTIRIRHIQIVGFASFDGRRDYNERLAASRAATIKEYMQSLYALPDSLFDVCNGGESWAELRYQLEKVEFEGKNEVLTIIDTEPDADKREVMIKKLNGGATYRYMRDELKRILRNLGCITVYCENVE